MFFVDQSYTLVAFFDNLCFWNLLLNFLMLRRVKLMVIFNCSDNVIRRSTMEIFSWTHKINGTCDFCTGNLDCYQNRMLKANLSFEATCCAMAQTCQNRTCSCWLWRKGRILFWISVFWAFLLSVHQVSVCVIKCIGWIFLNWHLFEMLPMFCQLKMPAHVHSCNTLL